MSHVSALVRSRATIAAVFLTVPIAAGLAPSPADAASAVSAQVHRGGPDAKVKFRTNQPGEAFLEVEVAARGVSWGERGNESAVVSLSVDGHYVTDVVITSDEPTPRELALGLLPAGKHTLRIHYAADRSPSRAGAASLRRLDFRTVPRTDPEYVAARYAPVLYGRNLPALGSPFQSATTDTPLVAWHEIMPATTPGHSVIEYSVIWSNEDGGTDTPALMARWGRSTDIEWVYRLEVDQDGKRVPGSDVYQAANHATLPFRGQYDGTHPLLETCTSNNNLCDTVDDPMRFALSTRDVRPVEQPREYLMDTHPWTYPVMAQEMLREGKIESPSDPATREVGDQRSYLYVAVDHDTTPPASSGGMGLAVDVRLDGDPTTYTSNHLVPDWSINRDVPAATTVELPIGTTPADVASVSVRRVPIGPTDNGSTLTVTDIDRAFLLGTDHLPQPSFVEWHGATQLTATAPSAELWSAG